MGFFLFLSEDFFLLLKPHKDIHRKHMYNNFN